MIPMILCHDGALSQPLLYLSLFFKEHRRLYYDHLQQVRLEGDWEAWLSFFLEGTAVTAEQGASLAHRLLGLFAEDAAAIHEAVRAPQSALAVHRLMQRQPILTSPAAVQKLSLTKPTINAAFDLLINLGIVRETTGRQRNRVYAYERYLEMLNEGIRPA
jgi:Fic family protein